MTDQTLAISSEAQIKVGSLGQEQQPIIMVDNAVSHPNLLVRYAADYIGLKETTCLYPGVRATTPKEYIQLLLMGLGRLISETFDISIENISSTRSFFSIVSTPVERLSLPQRVPHIDGPNPKDLAFIHYLCDNKYGGTSFYRHRETGFEYIDEKRMPGYLVTLEQQVATTGLEEPPHYVCGNTPLFEKVSSIEARFNRLLIYRGTSLHSGDIAKNYNFDQNPRTGRLTVTSFLYSQA